jgi:NAD(P)H-dependent flavin oxidoreductase YrpB (nitropropane dioxygenase family)
MVPISAEPAEGACGKNFLLPFDPSLDDIAEVAGRCRAVDFFYDDPRSDVVEAVHDAGALAGWQAGSAEEARAAEEAGCDYVVAQGTEAGGHVRATRPLDEVLPATLAAVDVPVVAAGGVDGAERFAELIASGADAVRVGTLFLACPEAGTHPAYVQALLAADGSQTTLTEHFGEGWEDAPHRVLTSALEAAQASGWRAAAPPSKDAERDPADMALYAGTGVGALTQSRPAADVVAELTRLL